jgi:hypothetical protein
MQAHLINSAFLALALLVTAAWLWLLFSAIEWLIS